MLSSHLIIRYTTTKDMAPETQDSKRTASSEAENTLSSNLNSKEVKPILFSGA